MTEHVGRPLGDQDLDLVYRAAELQVAHVEARGQPVSAAPLVCQDVLEVKAQEILESFRLKQLSDVCVHLHLYGDDEDV